MNGTTNVSVLARGNGGRGRIGARVVFNQECWLVAGEVGRDPRVPGADSIVYRLEPNTWAAPMRPSQQVVS